MIERCHRLFLLISILGALGIHAYAQSSSATISFQIFDQATGNPLPASTSLLLQLPDSGLVTGTLTDDQGRGSFQGIAPGSYLMKASYLGFSPIEEVILVGRLNQYYDLGRLYLTPSTTQLSEVLIEGEQSALSTALDKKSFSLDGNISQIGGSALDAMRGLPGITVDAEGKVLLRGSDQVAILIDGQQSSLTGFGNQQGLENIPAANIERVEIINNPSAKYDASGMAGIINLIYKEDKQLGLNGDLGFTYGLGELTERRPDLPTELGRFSLNPKYIPSLNLNYNRSHWNAFLRAEVLRQRKLPNNEFNTRTYEDGRIIASQVPENRTQTQYILNGGIDLQLNERNQLGFSAIVDYENHVDTAQVPYINLSSAIAIGTGQSEKPLAI